MTTPGNEDKGGQQPTDEPRGGQTSAEAAGSIRDRLRSPEPTYRANDGGDERHNDLTDNGFQQTDSRAELQAKGRDEQQRSHAAGVEPQQLMVPRKEDLDPAAAKAAERQVAALFLLSVIGVVGFVLTYFLWPFEFGEEGNTLYTPLLGVFMTIALAGIGAGAVHWAKRLMVDEEAVQERHPFGSPEDERQATAAALKQGFDDAGIKRRPLLIGSLGLAGGALALLPIPFVFGLGRFQHKERVLAKTSWYEGSRLMRSDGSAVKMGDLQLGGIEIVFPDVEAHGNAIADSGTMLIRMRPDVFKPKEGREDWAVEGHVAYSIICTHLGCPVKLYEQQTHYLFCPCHQSTFDAADSSKVLFGPAARPLPQLAIAVDDEGYFVAQGDYSEPTGASYWERG